MKRHRRGAMHVLFAAPGSPGQRAKEHLMGLLDFIKKQFIDILQWTEDGDGVLAWRFPMAENEIQMGASLTVRESQVAVFVDRKSVV